MNSLKLVFLAIAFSSTTAASSEPLEADAPAALATAEAPGVPLLTLLRDVAKKSGKKMIVDSRVRGNVQLIGEEAGNVTYGELLTILQVHGYTAVEGGGLVRVIPEARVRQSAPPLMVGTTAYPDAQYVAAVIPVLKVPAASLVPILRPLLPQQAHLAASVCSNTLIMVDTFANVRRIESLVAAIDSGDSYKPYRCEKPSP